MRRHVIAGRLGSGDKTDIPSADDEILTRVNLVSAQKRIDYGIGQALDGLKDLSVFPTELGLDLLVLAAHVHAADTRIARSTESQDTWTREIRLVVPVSNPTVWRGASPTLKRMLDFLTGDLWTIGFRTRHKGFETAVPTRPKQSAAKPFDSVSLFSGGLDSLIGAIDTLEGGKHPLFVSHAGEGATSDAQNNVFAELQKHYKNQPVSRLRVWMAFEDGLVKKVAGENTTRARSFLFFALGVFAGSGLGGTFTLRVPENGLIALNVPLDPLRVGALSTRTTHPFYIARWNELLRALGISGQVENPYWNKTKGEMVSGCANRKLLTRLIPSSLSCSSPAKARWQGHGIEHCGYCLPCLIRRAAIRAALGSTGDATTYTVQDLHARSLDTRQAEGQQVRSFQFAIERLRKHPEFAKTLIHKPGPLFDETARLTDLAAVYRRGLEEVAALLAGVSARPA